MARSFGEQSLKLKEKLGIRTGLASTLNALGISAGSSGQTQAATAYFERAIAEARLAGDRGELARSLMNLGVLLVRQDNDSAAIPLFEECLKVTLELNQLRVASFARVNLAGGLTRQKRAEEALPLTRDALDWARQSGNLSVAFMASDAMANAFNELKRYGEAEAAWRDAIEALEEQVDSVVGPERQARFLTNKLYVYDRLANLLIEQNRAEEAFRVVERIKDRLISDAIRSGQANIDKVLTADERAKEGDLRKRLASDPGLKSRSEYRDYLTGLYVAHPELKVQRVDIEPSTPAELVAALPPDTAMIEYVFGHPDVRMFVITRSANGSAETKTYRLAIDHDDLKAKVRQFDKQLGTRDLAFQALSRELYKLLIEPAAQQLRGRRALVIVPDHFLWGFSFQALQAATGRYLIEDHQVSYAHSLTMLRAMIGMRRDRTPGAAQVAALGAEGVPGGRRIAQLISDLYGTGNTRVLLDAAANAANLRAVAQEIDVLHISAHGIYRDDDPLASYLLLPSGERDQQILARDLMTLHTKARLVVLSGCETGKDSSVIGEGLVGFSWALFVAGSPTTVASQWKVDADATSELMLSFYRSLRGGASPSLSLQKAALYMLSQPRYRHPFYWAGFSVIGAGI